MKNKLIITALVALFATGLAMAHEGTRIGVVDADRVIQESDKGKTFFTQYEATINAKRDEIRAMNDDLQARQADMQAKAASLSEAKAREMAIELEDMQKKIQRAQEDAQRETQGILQTRLEEFQKELVPLIRVVAQEMNLDMVINLGVQSNLVYFSESINITQAVIDKYNAQ